MTGESARAKARRLKQVTAHGQRVTEAEEATATALMALPPSWVVLDDPQWPRRRFTNIDHVVIGPPGVFVIDTKHCSGRKVVVDNGVLAQGGHDRKAVVWAAAAAAASVSELVPSLRPDYVRGVVCLADGGSRVSRVDGVLVCSSSELVGQLTGCAEVLPGGLARAVAVDLGRRLGPAERPGREPPSSGNRRPLAAAVPIVLALALGTSLLTHPDMITSLLDEAVGLVR